MPCSLTALQVTTAAVCGYLLASGKPATALLLSVGVLMCTALEVEAQDQQLRQNTVDTQASTGAMSSLISSMMVKKQQQEDESAAAAAAAEAIAKAAPAGEEDAYTKLVQQGLNYKMLQAQLTRTPHQLGQAKRPIGVKFDDKPSAAGSAAVAADIARKTEFYKNMYSNTPGRQAPGAATIRSLAGQ